MDMTIKTPKISEILFEEFMEPLGISAYKLALEIHVPVSRIQDILHDRRKRIYKLGNGIDENERSI